MLWLFVFLRLRASSSSLRAVPATSTEAQGFSLPQRGSLPASHAGTEPGCASRQLRSLGLGRSEQHCVSIPQLKNRDNNPQKPALRMNELIFTEHSDNTKRTSSYSCLLRTHIRLNTCQEANPFIYCFLEGGNWQILINLSLPEVGKGHTLHSICVCDKRGNDLFPLKVWFIRGYQRPGRSCDPRSALPVPDKGKEAETLPLGC